PLPQSLKARKSRRRVVVEPRASAAAIAARTRHDVRIRVSPSPDYLPVRLVALDGIRMIQTRPASPSQRIGRTEEGDLPSSVPDWISTRQPVLEEIVSRRLRARNK